MPGAMMTALNEILSAYRVQEILIIGDVFLDVYHDTVIRSEETEDSILIADIVATHYQAGGAATLARICAGLGLNCRLVGVVGDDVEANLLQHIIGRHSAIASALSTTNERPTPVKTRYRDSGRLRFRADKESVTELSHECADAALAGFPATGNFSQCVLIADYRKGSHPLWKVPRFQQAAQKCFIAADSRASLDELPVNLGLLKKNRLEWRDIVAEIEARFGNRPPIECLADRYGTREVQVTLDVDGMELISAKGDVFGSPTFARSIISETSAGNAAFVLCALARSIDISPHMALALSSAAAACTLAKLGSEVVSLDELRTFILSLPE
jgi:rfaE bifunctional protein kinase chain/domain